MGLLKILWRFLGWFVELFGFSGVYSAFWCKKCKNCGRDIKNSDYCSYCGQKYDL